MFKVERSDIQNATTVDIPGTVRIFDHQSILFSNMKILDKKQTGMSMLLLRAVSFYVFTGKIVVKCFGIHTKKLQTINLG